MLRRPFFPRIFALFLIAILSMGIVPSVLADEAPPEAPPPKPLLNSEEAKDLIAVLNDPAQREKIVSTLKSLQKVESAKDSEDPHSVVEGAVHAGKDLLQKAVDAFHAIIDGIANFKALWPWLLQVWNDPALQSEIFRICIRVALVGLGGWGLSFVFYYVFRGIRGKFKEKAKTIGIQTLEADTKLGAAKKSAEEALEKEEDLEEQARQKRKLAETAAQEEAEREASISEGEEKDLHEALAHAENLAARQALEASENQAIVAQTMALSDTPGVQGEIAALSEEEAAEHISSRKEGGAEPGFSAEEVKKSKKSQPSSHALEAAEKIKKLEAAADAAEAELQEVKHTAQLAQQNYNELRIGNHKENLLRRWRRTLCALGAFALDLFGIAMFPFLALLIQILDPSPDARTMAAVWSVTWFANVVQTLWVAVLRVLFSPVDPWLRLAAVSDSAASFLFKWLRRISGFVAWSLTIIIILQACTLPGSVSSAIGKLIGLFANLMLAWMILGARSYVARACVMIASRKPRLATITRLVHQLWWIVALFFDFALWWVWLMNMRDGYQFIFWTFLKTCLVLAAARLLWGMVQYFLAKGDRWIRQEDNLTEEMQERFLRYYPALQKALGIVVLLLAFLGLSIAWGAPAGHIFASNSFGAHLLSSCGTIFVALCIGVFIWEGANIFFDRQSQKLEDADLGKKQRAARIRTLQPLFKILLLIVLMATIGMTILSELGINVAPLLASASIFGVAIGFGSQKLVHDFISGVFLLLENALSVGDMVTLNNTYGRVEKLSLRTVHVRASNGSLNIFPFSALNEITNYSRGFCRAMIEANVSYDTKVADVQEVFFEITESLKKDPDYGDFIIDDLNFWGLDHFNDSTLSVKASLPVTPAGRWPVTYEFNRRICEEFEKRKIKLPFPMRTLDFPSLEAFVKSEERKYQKSEA